MDQRNGIAYRIGAILPEMNQFLIKGPVRCKRRPRYWFANGSTHGYGLLLIYG